MPTTFAGSWHLYFASKLKTSLLDTYNEERLPFAKWLLTFTDRMFNLMTTRNWFIRTFRKYVALKLAGVVLTIHWIRPLIFNTISQIWYSYKGKKLSHSLCRQKLSFNAGDRLPYFSEGNIYPLFKKPSFHVLYIGHQSLGTAMKERVSKVFPFTVEVVEDLLSAKWEKLGVKSELFILVRPDNYIAGIYDALSESETRKHMERYFIYKN